MTAKSSLSPTSNKPSAKPLVSVIMPVYNTELYLAEAIDSFLAQTFSDFELILVDDGSTDNSAAIIQAYVERDSRVRSFPLPLNMGEAAARNHGHEQARGELLAIADSDDVFAPDRLEKQVAFLRANPEIGVLGGCLEKVKPDLTPMSVIRSPQRHSLIVLHLFLGSFIFNATVMMRREVFDSAVAYDTSLTFGVDLDLWSRMLMRGGVRFHNLPDVLMRYRIHPASISRAYDPASLAMADIPRLNMLEALWGVRDQGAVDRFATMLPREKLSLPQWLLLNRDLRRLVKALVAAKWVDEADKDLLWATVVQRADDLGPYLWRKFGAWRRYRLPWLFPDRFNLY